MSRLERNSGKLVYPGWCKGKSILTDPLVGKKGKENELWND